MKIILDFGPLQDFVIQAMLIAAEEEHLDLHDDQDCSRAMALAWQRATDTGRWQREAGYVDDVDDLHVDFWHAVLARCDC